MLGQQAAGHFVQVLGNVAAGHRIDGRATHLQPQAGQRDGAHAGAGTIAHLARLSRQDAQIHRQVGAIGAVRVVTGKFLHIAMSGTVQALAFDPAVMNGEGVATAIGQQAFHSVGYLSGDEADGTGAGGRGRAGPGGKAGTGATRRLAGPNPGCTFGTGFCRCCLRWPFPRGRCRRDIGTCLHRVGDVALPRVRHACAAAFFCSASASASSACRAATTRVEPPLRP